MKRLILTLLLGLITAIVVWYGFNPLLQHHEPISTSPPILASATVFPKPQPIASFSLTDTNQHNFTEKNLQGHWTLIFFGYAHCPMICPQAMAVASNFWKALPTEARDHSRFVFVTLDPETDKIDDLKHFLGHFNADFMGLTGNQVEVQKLAKSCRAFSFEDPKNKTASGHKNIDHSAAFILINPEGRVQALFSPPHDASIIAKDLAKLLSERAN